MRRGDPKPCLEAFIQAFALKNRLKLLGKKGDDIILIVPGGVKMVQELFVERARKRQLKRCTASNNNYT